MGKSSFECKKVLISLLQTVELESSCMTWIVQEFGDNFEPNIDPGSTPEVTGTSFEDFPSSETV